MAGDTCRACRSARAAVSGGVALKIAFLGVGRLGGAIARSLVLRAGIAPQDVCCVSKSGVSAQSLASELGVKAESSIESAATTADIVVLAFKPQTLVAVEPELTQATRDKLVISLLAGKRLARLARACPSARNVVRAMPNTPGAIGAGITPYCSIHTLKHEDAVGVLKILGALGKVMELEERYFDAVTSLSAGGPAFIYQFLIDLIAAGQAAGLPVEVSEQLVRETFIGSAALLSKTNLAPQALRDQVVSPNGTTHAGLERARAQHFSAIVSSIVSAASDRASELAGD